MIPYRLGEPPTPSTMRSKLEAPAPAVPHVRPVPSSKSIHPTVAARTPRAERERERERERASTSTPTPRAARLTGDNPSPTHSRRPSPAAWPRTPGTRSLTSRRHVCLRTDEELWPPVAASYVSASVGKARRKTDVRWLFGGWRAWGPRGNICAREPSCGTLRPSDFRRGFASEREGRHRRSGFRLRRRGTRPASLGAWIDPI